MYYYDKNNDIFTQYGIKIAFSEQQKSNIKKAGDILKQAKGLPLNKKLNIHNQVKKVIGGGDYMTCAKVYANIK